MKLQMMTHGDPHQYRDERGMSYSDSQQSSYYQVGPMASEYQAHAELADKYYVNLPMNPYVPTSGVETAQELTPTTYAECDSAAMANDDLLLKVAEEQLRPLIKEELRNTIQSKRIAKGLPSHVEIEYKEPQNEPETPSTILKRQRRRERNKLAAAKCRFKKKVLSEKLMEESYDLENQNQRLKTEVQRLQDERQKLMYILNLHRPTCIVRSPSVTSHSQVLNNSPQTASSSNHMATSCSMEPKQNPTQSPSSRTSSYDSDSNGDLSSIFTYPPYSADNSDILPVSSSQRSVIVQSNAMQRESD